MTALPFTDAFDADPSVTDSGVHRFQETIGGRAYVIEVAAVSPDRWRAHIVRIPGVPTALMPFYGRTPDEALAFAARCAAYALTVRGAFDGRFRLG